jgi:hypothetical protein
MFLLLEKEQYTCLPEVMSMVASEEMVSLPAYVQQCSVVYIPEVGYLLSIMLWNENLSKEDLQIAGLEYKVKINTVFLLRSGINMCLYLISLPATILLITKAREWKVRITHLRG